MAVVAFGAVAVFALSGLFDFVEGAFFQPRIQQRSIERAESLADAIDERHRVTMQRYASVLSAPHVVSAFLSNQSRDTITERRNAFDRLHVEFPSLLFARFISDEGDAIHYSTLPTDIVRGGDFARTYAIPRDLEDPPSSSVLRGTDDEPLVVSEPDRDRLVYSFPISDQFGVLRGTGLFYVAVSDLANHLIRVRVAEFRRLDLVAGGVLINSPEPSAPFRAAATQAWAQPTAPAVTGVRLSADASSPLDNESNAASEQFVLFTGRGEFGRVGLVIAADELRIPEPMRWTLLGAAAATLFLLVFLILNLRQDPTVVLADRIKRFQVTFLREFLEERDRLDWDEWRNELSIRKAEVKARLTSGGGRPKRNIAESERLFDRSWEDIVSVLASRAELAQRPAPNVTVDAAQIEQIVRRALAAGLPTEALPALAAATRTAPPAATGPTKAEEVEALEEVAEAEEVEALEEVAEVEEVEALEEVAEAEEVAAVDEPPDVEQPIGAGSVVEELLDDLEEGEELETEEVAEFTTGDTSDSDDATIEELAEVAPMDALPPDRPYEELEELEELEEEPLLSGADDDAAAPARFAVVDDGEGSEEIEELDEYGEMEEIEPLDEVEALEEVEEAAPTDAAAVEAVPFVDRLRDSGKILSFSLEELVSAVSEVRESVALEDGVYRIKPEMVASRGKTKSLFRLAERARSKEAGDPSVGGPQSIGDLFGGTATVDSLFGEEAGRGDQPETLSSLRGASRERRLPVSDAGLQLDQLLRQYPRPKDETTLVRCLVNLSRPLDAVGTVLMEPAEDGYVATQTVGLMEGSAASHTQGPGNELYDRHLHARDVVLLFESLSAIPGLAQAFAPEDAELVKRILYLPVRYRDADGYLLLGSREADEAWDLPLLVNKLALHPS